jgi:hypothetical protein
VKTRFQSLLSKCIVYRYTKKQQRAAGQTAAALAKANALASANGMAAAMSGLGPGGMSGGLGGMGGMGPPPSIRMGPPGGFNLSGSGSLAGMSGMGGLPQRGGAVQAALGFDP